jgi:hypothetical protein
MLRCKRLRSSRSVPARSPRLLAVLLAGEVPEYERSDALTIVDTCKGAGHIMSGEARPLAQPGRLLYTCGANTAWNGRMCGTYHIARLTLFLFGCTQGVALCDHASRLFSA